jgi:hypothetical protein
MAEEISFQFGYATRDMAETSPPVSSFSDDGSVGARLDQPGIRSSVDEDVPLMSRLASPL